MKAIFVTTFLLLVGMAAGAQNKEQGFFVEAGVSYASTENENFVTIAPAVGYQFNSYLAGGMKVGFETRTYPYTIYTPFFRYSFFRKSRLKLFTEAQFNIATRDVDGGQSSYGEIGLSLGATYSIGKHVRLVGHYLFVGYSGDEDESGARMQKGNFALDANVCRLQLGVQYLF